MVPAAWPGHLKSKASQIRVTQSRDFASPAILNTEFRITAPEGFGKRKDKVGRRIFCTTHLPKRLLALKNDLQQVLFTLHALSSPGKDTSKPLHHSYFAPSDRHLPYYGDWRVCQGDLPFLESSCRHLNTKPGAFQALFKKVPKFERHLCFADHSAPQRHKKTFSQATTWFSLLQQLEKTSLEQNRFVISPNPNLNIRDIQ